MKKLTAYVLLFASLIPSVLSGRPVYHCTVTGTESFLSLCCPDPAGPAAPACCPRCANRERAEAERRAADPSRPVPSCTVPSIRVRGDHSTVCACCEVSTFKILSVDPREELPGADSLRAAALQSTLAVEVIDPARAPLHLFQHRGHPISPRQPPPTLYTVLRR